jgi:hypothetical protein
MGELARLLEADAVNFAWAQAAPQPPDSADLQLHTC